MTGEVRSELRSDGVLSVVLDRPEKANAYTRPMLDSLHEAVLAAEEDPQVRVIVVAGGGNRHFCAGADRDEIEARDWRSVLRLKAAKTFDALLRSTRVTVASIQGAAMGGGFELALACDVRIAHESAVFALPEPGFGLIPAAGGTRLLPIMAGPLRAKDVILGGARWSAVEAQAAGVVSEVVSPPETLDARVRSWVERILERDPNALRFAKELIHRSVGVDGETGPALTAQAILASLRNPGRNPGP